MKGDLVSFQSKKAFFRGSTVRKVKKKWGEEHWIVNKEYCGKKLILKKKHRCSMHSHKEKDEVFYLQSGKVLLELSGKKHTLCAGDFIHIKQGSPHRFTGIEDSEIFEFSTTHKEDDSYRTEFSGHVDQEIFDRQTALVEKFSTVNVLVIGDIMLDTYIQGSVNRVSPEAPIPVVKQNSSWYVPGGAANAAHNIAALGGEVTCIGVRGNDDTGTHIEKILKKSGVASMLIKDRSRSTTEKLRILANGNHQVVRLDREDCDSISATVEKALLSRIKVQMQSTDVVLISDYNKGVCTLSLLQNIIKLAKKQKIPVVVDPKPRGADYVKSLKGATLLTPNRGEGKLMTSKQKKDSIAKALNKVTGANVLLTLGGDGMLLSPVKGKQISIEPHKVEVADISGAGDTVVAVVALALGAGGTLADAADIANHAGSVVVKKMGTATLSPKELLATL